MCALSDTCLHASHVQHARVHVRGPRRMIGRQARVKTGRDRRLGCWLAGRRGAGGRTKKSPLPVSRPPSTGGTFFLIFLNKKCVRGGGRDID